MKVRELIQQHVLHPHGRWVVDVRHGLVVRVDVGHDRREPSLSGQLQHSATGVSDAGQRERRPQQARETAVSKRLGSPAVRERADHLRREAGPALPHLPERLSRHLAHVHGAECL